ncbi:hypothetical protein VTH06DRAFT_3669 [Thermothelomyces fergusii]
MDVRLAKHGLPGSLLAMNSPASDAVLPSRVTSKRPGTASKSRRMSRVAGLSPFLALWVSFLLFLDSFGRSSAEVDPVKHFCRRFGHQTALIDRKLYIDGGFMNYSPRSQYPANYSNHRLQYHDLDTLGDGLMPQLYTNLTKNDTIPDVNGGTLWADNVNKRFYLFAGEYDQEPPSPQFTLWSYDTISDTWQSFGSPPKDDMAAVSYGAGVSVSEIGEGYYYGGWRSNNTIPGWSGPRRAASDLVRYDMDANSWSAEPGPDSIGRAEGVMVFIPVGDSGMLVYFGGVQEPYGNGTWIGQPLDTVFLYDVLSSKWYAQSATGEVPPMRRRFCAGATWAADQSSYNIYLYGGAGMPPDTAGFDDVYTLSIPSFEWIKMFPTDGNKTGPSPHHSLTCDVVDSAQMIVMGGTFPTTDSCDAPAQYGLHNMDLGMQNEVNALWRYFKTNLTQYAVPDPIVRVIGGSASGGATKTAPAHGFSHPDLRVLMTRKASIATRTPTRAIPSATGSPEANDGSLSAGAIAGIAVGGAVALLTLLTALFFIRRFRRRKYDTTTTTTPTATTLLPPYLSPPSDAGAWSSVTYTTLSNNPYSSHSPYSPHSAFANHAQTNGTHHISGPAELSAPVGAELPAELTPPASAPALAYPWTNISPATGGFAGSSIAEAGTETATSTGSGEPIPRTKIDADGHVWVQVTSHLERPERPAPLVGSAQAARKQVLEPQELSAEPSPGPGDRDAHPHHEERPRHLTFYHP